MRRQRKTISEINVVPYIDVMLVLLVIFMITTPLLSQGVNIDLPKAKSAMIAEQDQPPIIVSVDQKGQYFLNIAADPEKVILPQVLATRVAAELQIAQKNHQTRVVLVKGDQQAQYGAVVQVMALLQQAGAQSVGLMTAPQETLATNQLS